MGVQIVFYTSTYQQFRNKNPHSFAYSSIIPSFTYMRRLWNIFISVFNQLDVQNLFHNKFYFMLLHVSSTCALHQEVKIVLHSLWYHHTETSEWSKITKIQFYKYEQIVVKFNFRPLTCFGVMMSETV